MTHLQQRWEGATLAGTYTLNECLSGDEGRAFFQASTSDGVRAVIKLVTAEALGGNPPLDLWHRIRQLRHPNLIELLDYGATVLDGEPAFFAVFEAPDDTLASALSRQSLTPEESREVLDGAIHALRYLHAQGLVIGTLDADHVLAVGDKIKLSIDEVHDAETSAAYREDVLLLGNLWRQALMAASPNSEELVAHAADPDPKTRWTLAEIHVALNPPAPPPPAPEEAYIIKETVPESQVRSEPPPLPRSVRRAPDPGIAFRFPRWILVGAGIFLLLIFALNRSRRAEPTAAPAQAIPAPPPPVQLPAPPPTRLPQPAAAAVTLTPATSAGSVIWRVIAFTYRSKGAAEKKVEQLNQNHPNLHAAVFSPSGRHGYYLVSLGGRMTRDEAVRLQRSARGKGLPRDLYVQNYSD